MLVLGPEDVGVKQTQFLLSQGLSCPEMYGEGIMQ